MLSTYFILESVTTGSSRPEAQRAAGWCKAADLAELAREPRQRGPQCRRWRRSTPVIGSQADRLGAVAQLGEHNTGSVGVRGSSPLSSTKMTYQAGWYRGSRAFRPCQGRGLIFIYRRVDFVLETVRLGARPRPHHIPR